MELTNSIEQVKQLSIVVILPVILAVLIYIIVRISYSKKYPERNKEYIDNINRISILLAIVVSTFLTAFSVGFMYFVITYMQSNNIIDDFKALYYIAYIFPVIPLIITIILITKFNKKFKKNREVV